MSARGTLPGGHRELHCTSCQQPAIALEAGAKCRQLKGCPGRMAERDTIAKGDVERCQRAGCGHAALYTLPMGGRVCRRCLSALASA